MPDPDITYPAKLNPEPPTEAQAEAHAETLAREGEKLFNRIERAHARTWDDYMRLADILGEISRVAMRLARVNSRQGRGYNEHMARLLAKRAPKLGDKARERLRASLLNIHENRIAVDEWRSTWTPAQQQAWLSPITVWDRFHARLRPPADYRETPTPIERLREAHAELHMLRRNFLPPGMPMAEVGANIFAALTPAEVVTLIGILQALLDATPADAAP